MLYNRDAPIPIIKGSPMALKTIMLDRRLGELTITHKQTSHSFPNVWGCEDPFV